MTHLLLLVSSRHFSAAGTGVLRAQGEAGEWWLGMGEGGQGAAAHAHWAALWGGGTALELDLR